MVIVLMEESSCNLMRSACNIVLRGTTRVRKVALISSVYMLAYWFFVTELFEMGCAKEVGIVESLMISKENTGFARKLLQSPEVVDGGCSNMSRVGRRTCSRSDISIFQGPAHPLPSGIPAYNVQILNADAGTSSCSIGDIHVKCGWFSSASLVDPRLFRRLNYDDCLVNDGEPLGPQRALFFQYANTFPYPLSVSSVAC